MRHRAEWTRKTVISIRNTQIVNHAVIATVFEGKNKNCFSSL
jgi:hypothetical protein